MRQVETAALLCMLLHIHPLAQLTSRTQHGYTQARTVASGRYHSRQSNSVFQPVVSYDSGGAYAYGVFLHDVNGDGKLDVLVAHDDGNIGVLLGRGDGTLANAISYAAGGQSRALTVGDLNGDGKPDIAVANLGSPGTVSILLGNGDGTFQAATKYSSGGQNARSIAAGDVNNDGKTDLLVADSCIDTGCGNGAVAVLLGNGDGSFNSPVLYNSGGYLAYAISVADFNNDGSLDVAAANWCSVNQCATATNGSLAVLLGSSSGQLQPAITYDAGGQFTDGITTSDLNSDGKLDLIAASLCLDTSCLTGSAAVALGNGDGTFQPVIVYGSGGYRASAASVSDINLDGKADLIFGNWCTTGDLQCENLSDGMTGLLLQNSDGTFQAATTYDNGGFQTYSIAAADLNGDGKPDLTVANNCAVGADCAHGTIGVLINVSLLATSTALQSSSNPSSWTQAVTFTATVSPSGSGIPTGTITFSDGTAILGTATLDGKGVATLTTSTLTIGNHSVTAAYNGDSQFAPSTSSILTQVVQGAIVVVSPTALDFGNQTVAISSSPQNVMLTNTGNITLSISSITITGTNSSEFSQTNTCGTSVAAGASCTISVTFTPATAGARSAAVTIADNASGSPQSVALTGVGVVPAVSLSPASLTFPTQLIFTTSKPQIATLTNTGLGLLTISSISASGQFAQTNNCGTSVNPGASCKISVTFTPTSKGTISGSVSITDNATGSPQRLALTGTGTYVQLSPTTVNFGTQPVGTTSLAHKITLTNKGSVAVSVSSISITGTNSRDFSQTNNCGTSVAAGASCFIKVTFTPSAKGSRTGAVSISDNGGGSPRKVSLTGTGT